MRLEAAANGIMYISVELRGSGSLLEISKPSDLEEQLKEREKKSSLIKLYQRCPIPLRKKQGLIKQEGPRSKVGREFE